MSHAAVLAPSAVPAPSAEEPSRINLFWLIRLRWGAASGQIATIVVVYAAGLMPLPLAALAAVVGLELASNVACVLWARRLPRVTEGSLGLIMVLDVVLLTTLLHLTGGPFNPFCFLYLVHIALAAVILRARWTWALAALSVGCLAALYAGDVWQNGSLDHAAHMARMNMHLEGMWVAMLVAAGFIVYFVTRVTRALADRERELAEARERTSRQDKLASLAALSAGAAHELSTPLSTIAVVAKELERSLAGAGGEAVEDARLIRREVARCRAILDHMSADAGQSSGETSVSRTIRELVAESLDGLVEPARVRVEIGPSLGERRVHVPPRSISQAIRVILKNALDASPDGRSVLVQASAEAQALRIDVRDEGQGMPPDVLARAGEPFFTTKGPGAGMGLGLFLSRAVVERIGGRLAIDSAEGRGTTVSLTLPTAAPEIAAAPSHA